MKVARFYAPGDLRVEEMTRPRPGPGELLLRVRACATCGTDVKIYNFGHHHLVPPRVLGHEVAGEVAELGEGTAGFAAGDRVQLIAAIPCGECFECRHRSMSICENQESIGYHYDGGFAESLVVPAKVLRVKGLNRIPDDLPFEEAAVTEPLACVVNGQELARVTAEDVVVVIGAGPIGCLHVRLARARGAARVLLIERSTERLEMSASRVAPDAAIDASKEDPVDAVRKLTDARGADVVITAAASGAAQEDALQMAARGGRISFFGGLPKDDPIIQCDSNLVHYRELTIVGANGSTPAHNTEALRLIATGAVPVGDLITDRLPLERVHDAISAVQSGESIKVVIEP
ncbi:MAG: zinc-dependent dehydrogenase [Actinomycetota bacterium]